MIKLMIELIGTIAFAVSGAIVGINKKMDILGVSVLGMTTAVGGGIIRDLLIGKTPPAAFCDPVYMMTALAVSLIVFIPSVSRHINLNRFPWVFTDSVGLGAFTIVGVTAGLPFENNYFAIFLGIITGVGGGVIRDICAGEIPMIFKKRFYACPCIISAIACALLYPCSDTLAILIGFTTTVLLRLLAARFRWHLPIAK